MGSQGRALAVALCTLSAALALAGAGTIYVSASDGAAPRAADRVATAEGLSVSISSVEAVAGHEMRKEMHRGNFDMPASMMPGAPAEGRQRLHVEVAIRNSSSSDRVVTPEEFWLRPEGARRRPPVSSTIDSTTLHSGQVLWIDLYFDVVSRASPRLYLEWTRGATTRRIPLATEAPSHQHDSQVESHQPQVPSHHPQPQVPSHHDDARAPSHHD